MQRRGPATSTGGGEGAAFVVRAARGSSRRLDSLGRRVAALRSKTGGQRGTGDAGGVNSSERRNSPSSDSRANSGEVGPGFWGKDLGEVPGCTAVLLRGLAELVAQRCGVAAAALRALRGGLKEAGRGSRRGSKEGNPGELGGIQARALRCGGEEAGRRARAAA